MPLRVHTLVPCSYPYHLGVLWELHDLRILKDYKVRPPHARHPRAARKRHPRPRLASVLCGAAGPGASGAPPVPDLEVCAGRAGPPYLSA